MKKIPQKHLHHIKRKLGKNKLNSIERVARPPKGIIFITWSLGVEAETHFFYKILDENNEVFYCEIITLLSLFILQSAVFKEVSKKEYVEYFGTEE